MARITLLDLSLLFFFYFFYFLYSLTTRQYVRQVNIHVRQPRRTMTAITSEIKRRIHIYITCLIVMITKLNIFLF